MTQKNGILSKITAPLRKLYDWTEKLAESKHSSWALFGVSFAESSFFPIPPDVLLLALGGLKPKKAFRYALICSVGSILGGIGGYCIGMFLFDAIGRPILEFYGWGAEEAFNRIGDLYRDYDAWAVGVSGFTPIPYKVFTIAAGVFKINFFVFVFASTVGRSARFFIEGVILWKFGPAIKPIIEKYFDWISILFVIFLIAGFFAVKWFAH